MSYARFDESADFVALAKKDLAVKASTQSLLAFEHLRVGDRWTSDSRTIGEDEIRLFAALTGDHDRLHVDPEFAASGPFGRTVAHGMLGMSIMVGLSSTAPLVNTSALVDIRGWNFCKPVFPGDTVRVITEVVDLKPHGRRHGEVHWYRQMLNQHGEKVQDGVLVTLVAREFPLSTKAKRVDREHLTPQPILRDEPLLEGV